MSGEFLPTHHCFDDALELLGELCRRFPIRHRLRLVHAICKAPDGNLYSHAYVSDVEANKSWFDAIHKGQQFTAEVYTDEYEAGLNIVEATRYTVDRAIAENHRSGHYGPWIDRYRELCSDQRRTFGEIPIESVTEQAADGPRTLRTK